MVAYYCTACWHVSPVFQRRCPACAAIDRFCTEQQYADLMIRYMHHPLRRYRIVALQNLKRMKWHDAIPEIQERIRIEKDPDVRAEAKKTLSAIETYMSRAEAPGSSAKQTDHMYDHLDETRCKVIPVRKVLRKRGHRHLRPGSIR